MIRGLTYYTNFNLKGSPSFIGIYLQKKNLPTPSQWKAEILQQGFPCELDDDLDLLTLSGFLPCRIKGNIAGFEYYSHEAETEEVSHIEETSELDLPLVDYGITLSSSSSSSSSSRELDVFSTLAAASCLAKLTGGYLVDFYSGKITLSEQAINWVKSLPEMTLVQAKL